MIYLEIPLVDGARLNELSLMDDDGSFVAELIDLFSTDSLASMSELEKAVADRDLDIVRKIAHRMKGSALSIGANRFAALAADIENDFDSASISGSAARLSELREETIEELRKHHRS